MAKIKSYEPITKNDLADNDAFLVETDNGTKTISAKELADNYSRDEIDEMFYSKCIAHKALNLNHVGATIDLNAIYLNYDRLYLNATGTGTYENQVSNFPPVPAYKRFNFIFLRMPNFQLFKSMYDNFIWQRNTNSDEWKTINHEHDNYAILRRITESDIDSWNAKESYLNKTYSLSSSSTDSQYPSAKAVYDAISNISVSPGSSITTDDVPSYVKIEAESTIAKANSHGILGRTIRFIAVSDAHHDSTGISGSEYQKISNGNKHCGQAIKYISDRIGLDFVASLGDMTWAGVNLATDSPLSTPEALHSDLRQMNEFLSEGFRGIPNIRLVGNHDQMKTNDNVRLYNCGAYNYAGRYNVGNKAMPAGYGYYDLESAKVRVIYLNTSDLADDTGDNYPGTKLGFSQAQKNWLCETLISVNGEYVESNGTTSWVPKPDASEWKILVLSHAPLDMMDDTPQQKISAAILSAYKSGGTYGNYTFDGHSAKIIGNCHGHVHCYNWGFLDGTSNGTIRRFAIPNAYFKGNNHYENRQDHAAWADIATYSKVENTGKDTAFSLVTIDLDNEYCYVDNYGAGVDRDFSCKYKTDANFPELLSISFVGYSGATSAGSAIDKTKFVFDATYSDGTTKRRNLPVIASPSTLQSGTNSITISYTEDGVTKTATATISTVSVKIPTSLSNITYSGVKTVGSTISGSSFSYTVHYNDNTTSDKTSTVTVSPSTIQSVGNNSVTISYTENGTTVTGTVTIIGEAVPSAYPTAISNITYTGVKTVGSTINTAAFSYTVTYSDNTSSVKTSTVSVSPATIQSTSSDTYAVSYTENGTTVTGNISITGEAVVVVNLLDLDRTYGPMAENDSIKLHLDTTKAFTKVKIDNTEGATKNTPIGHATNKNYTVNTDLSTNSMVITEPNEGGLYVAFPISIDPTKACTVQFGYDGRKENTGGYKCRTYYCYCSSSDVKTRNDLYVNETSGANGTANVTIPAPTSTSYNYLVLLFGTNTGGTIAFSNILVAQ